MSQQIIGGLDEVGWGALAGPIVSVVAVFRPLDLAFMPPGVKDSKKTTEAQRRMLYEPLCRSAFDVGVGHAWPWEIDTYGPGEALQLSYRRALDDVRRDCAPHLLIVDGSNRVSAWKGEQRVEPKADVKYKEVSAASIIAKVFRDCIMEDYAKTWPEYGWNLNKGYGTTDHTDAIQKYGALVNVDDRSKYIHRLRYCRNLLKKKA